MGCSAPRGERQHGSAFPEGILNCHSFDDLAVVQVLSPQGFTAESTGTPDDQGIPQRNLVIARNANRRQNVGGIGSVCSPCRQVLQQLICLVSAERARKFPRRGDKTLVEDLNRDASVAVRPKPIHQFERLGVLGAASGERACAWTMTLASTNSRLVTVMELVSRPCVGIGAVAYGEPPMESRYCPPSGRRVVVALLHDAFQIGREQPRYRCIPFDSKPLRSLQKIFGQTERDVSGSLHEIPPHATRCSTCTGDRQAVGVGYNGAPGLPIWRRAIALGDHPAPRRQLLVSGRGPLTWNEHSAVAPSSKRPAAAPASPASAPMPVAPFSHWGGRRGRRRPPRRTALGGHAETPAT